MSEIPYDLIKPIRGGRPLGRLYRQLVDDSDWVCEAKMNGKRCLWADDTVWSRSGLVHTRNAEVRQLLEQHFSGIDIDGELMPQDNVFWMFDLPNHPGTYDQRRAALAALIAKVDSPHIRLMPLVTWEDVDKNGYEGVVFKRRDSLYEKGIQPGQTTRKWMKFRAEWL